MSEYPAEGITEGLASPKTEQAAGMTDDGRQLAVMLGIGSDALETPESTTDITTRHVAMTLLGSLLNLLSGFVNVVCWVGFQELVTHMTGTATMAGWAFALSKWLVFAHETAKMAAFVLGAGLASAYVASTQSRLEISPRNRHLLAAISALLYLAACLELHHARGERRVPWIEELEVLLLCLTAGLQNSLSTLLAGPMMRTTHQTGSCTDIGIQLGRIIFDGPSSSADKLRLLLLFVASYILGSAIGMACFSFMQEFAILVPATVMMAIACLSGQKTVAS